MSTARRFLLLGTAFSTFLFSSATWSAALGDPAGALTVSKWIKGGPVDLEAGMGRSVFVVEFWATWCVPCRDSIPHLTNLQRKYEDANVVFIGISAEAAGTVAPYVANMGSTMDYTIAIDTSRRTHRAFMGAYDRTGIPSAFVVDFEGNVAWHGHPMDGLDAAITHVLEGGFEVQNTWSTMKRQTGTRDELGEYFELSKSGADDQARALGETILRDGREDVPLLTMLAWTILTEPELSHRDLALAVDAARTAFAASNSKDAMVAHVYARALYESGEVARAIHYQRKAVGLALDERSRAELTETLHWYEEARR